jgi:hypothetical protein
MGIPDVDWTLDCIEHAMSELVVEVEKRYPDSYVVFGAYVSTQQLGSPEITLLDEVCGWAPNPSSRTMVCRSRFPRESMFCEWELGPCVGSVAHRSGVTFNYNRYCLSLDRTVSPAKAKAIVGRTEKFDHELFFLETLNETLSELAREGLKVYGLLTDTRVDTNGFRLEFLDSFERFLVVS